MVENRQQDVLGHWHDHDHAVQAAEDGPTRHTPTRSDAGRVPAADDDGK